MDIGAILACKELSTFAATVKDRPNLGAAWRASLNDDAKILRDVVIFLQNNAFRAREDIQRVVLVSASMPLALSCEFGSDIHDLVVWRYSTSCQRP